MRKVSESIKQNIAGKQRYKCANKPGSTLKGLENYECPLWTSTIDSENKGCFDESGYEVDYTNSDDNSNDLRALCKNCHSVKTKKFMQAMTEHNVTNNSDDCDNDDKNRYFELVDEDTGESSGRQLADTPKQACSIFFTVYIKQMKNDDIKIPNGIHMFVREITDKPNQKIYGFAASRQKLDKPQKLTIVDKETGEEKTITYNYRNQIRKIVVPNRLQHSTTD